MKKNFVIIAIFVLALLISGYFSNSALAFSVSFFIQPPSDAAPCNAQLSVQVSGGSPPPWGYKVTYDCGTGDGQGCVHNLPGQNSIADYCMCHYPVPGVYTATVKVKNKNTGYTITKTATFTATDSGCTDSDSDVNHYNGKDYDEFGICQDASGSHSDQCTPSGTLTEYYCKSGTCKSASKTCSGGKVCSGGACVAGGVCGDGVVDPGEDCDSGGVDTPTCDSDCTSVVCGDGYINTAAGESCDGANLGGKDCTDFGFASPGGLSCSASCTFDTSGCGGAAGGCSDTDIDASHPTGNNPSVKGQCIDNVSCLAADDPATPWDDTCWDSCADPTHVNEYSCTVVGPGGTCVGSAIPIDCAPGTCSAGACSGAPGPCNNNGVCEAGEDHLNCPNDCPCDYDGVCELTQGENNFNCTDCMGGGGDGGGSTALSPTDVARIISNFGDFLFKVAIGLVVILIIVGALYFILAGKDPSKLAIAKKIIFYTLIGLFIVLLAGGIIGIIRTLIGA